MIVCKQKMTYGESLDTFQIFLQLLLLAKFLEQATRASFLSFFGKFSGKHTQNEIQHEKGAEDHECYEVDPRPFASNSIIDLNARLFILFTT